MKNIKKQLIIISIYCISITFSIQSLAQSKEKELSLNPDTKYSVWISTYKHTNKGNLYKVLDDSITLSNYNETVFNTYLVNNIKSIQLRDKRRLGVSVGIGTVVGGIVGGTIAQSIRRNPEHGVFKELVKEINKGASIMLGTISGGLLGFIIGSVKINIPINGDKNKYRSVQYQLNRVSKVK